MADKDPEQRGVSEESVQDTEDLYKNSAPQRPLVDDRDESAKHDDSDSKPEAAQEPIDEDADAANEPEEDEGPVPAFIPRGKLTKPTVVKK